VGYYGNGSKRHVKIDEAMITTTIRRGEIRPRLKLMPNVLMTWQEVVFRGCMIPLLVAAGFSRLAIIFGSPVFFGVAHLHHALQMIREGRPVSEDPWCLLDTDLRVTFPFARPSSVLPSVPRLGLLMSPVFPLSMAWSLRKPRAEKA
jgi:hypothetical protein